MRNLLLKAKGARTVAQFAQELNKNPVIVNRWLSLNPVTMCPDSLPSEEDLVSISKIASNGVTLYSLRKIFGYPVVKKVSETTSATSKDGPQKAREFIDSAKTFYNTVKETLPKFIEEKADVSFSSLIEFLNIYSFTYFPYENIGYETYVSKDKNYRKMHNLPDNTDALINIVRVSLSDASAKRGIEFACSIAATITDDKQFLIKSVNFEGPDSNEKQTYLTYIRHRDVDKSAKEKLLDAIFGKNTNKYLEIVHGFGMPICEQYYFSNSRLIQNFCATHRDAIIDLCAGNKNYYTRIINGENPVEVFKDYPCMSTGCTGIGGFIADVMSTELNVSIEFWSDDEDENFDNIPCIMLNNDILDNSGFKYETIRDYFAECAKELGINVIGNMHFKLELIEENRTSNLCSCKTAICDSEQCHWVNIEDTPIPKPGMYRIKDILGNIHIAVFIKDLGFLYPYEVVCWDSNYVPAAK